jgi:hypothetical protein
VGRGEYRAAVASGQERGGGHRPATAGTLYISSLFFLNKLKSKFCP